MTVRSVAGSLGTWVGVTPTLLILVVPWWSRTGLLLNGGGYLTGTGYAQDGNFLEDIFWEVWYQSFNRTAVLGLVDSSAVPGKIDKSASPLWLAMAGLLDHFGGRQTGAALVLPKLWSGLLVESLV